MTTSIEKGDKVVVQFSGGLRLGGSVMGRIEANGREPVLEVAYLAGGHGQHPISAVIDHKPKQA